MVNDFKVNKVSLKKYKKRILNKTKKKKYHNTISEEPNKYLSTQELYNSSLYSQKTKTNDIIKKMKYFKYNQERESIKNKSVLYELNNLQQKAIDIIGNKHISSIYKKINNKNKQNIILSEIDLNYYIYKEFNKDYYDHKIKHFCNTYDLINVESLAKHFDYFDIKNIDFNPSHTKMSFVVDFIGNRNYHFFVKDLFNQDDIKHIDLSNGKDKLISIHDTLGQKINYKQISSNYYWIDDNTIIYITYNKYYNNTKCYTYNIEKKTRRLIYNCKDNRMLGLNKVYSEYYFILTSSSYTNDEIYLIDILHDNLYTSKNKLEFINEPVLKAKPFVKYHYINHIDATWYILRQNKDTFDFLKTKDFDSFEVLFTKKNLISIKEIIYLNNMFVFFIHSKHNFYIEIFNLCSCKMIKDKNQYNLCDINDSCYMEIVNHVPLKDKLIFYSSSFTNKHKIYELILDKTEQVSMNQINNNNYFSLKHSHNYTNNFVEKVIFLKNNSIVITQLYKKGLKLNNCKCLLYGYGSYGDVYDSKYNINKLLYLCEQGFLIIISHISGDGRLGFSQYKNGMLMNKKNTFTDFIYIIEEYLFKHDITSKDKLAIWGRSAGGLLIGSVLNMRPDICNLAILGVPFISPVLTMSSKKNPLGFESHSEWGNPLNKLEHDYIQSYSPYQNIKPCGNYPNMFIYSNLNDTLVPYKEPYMYYKKMVNTVNVYKEGEKDILLHIEDKFGHSQGTASSDYLKTISTIYATIEKYIK